MGQSVSQSDWVEYRFAQFTHLAPFEKAVEAELVEARVREALVLVGAKADGTAGRWRTGPVWEEEEDKVGSLSFCL